jgi:hypothetical protein
MKTLIAFISLFLMSFNLYSQSDIEVMNVVATSYKETGYDNWSVYEPTELRLIWNTSKGVIEINSRTYQRFTYKSLDVEEYVTFTRLKGRAKDGLNRNVIITFYNMLDTGERIFLVEYNDVTLRYLIH